jgi:hypothetical protein
MALSKSRTLTVHHAPPFSPAPQKNSGNIKLDALPPRLQEQLAAFDVDGDGDLSVAEVARAVEMYKAANQRARHLAWLASGLLVALLAIIAITFGVTYASSMAVVQATKGACAMARAVHAARASMALTPPPPARP